MVSDRHIGAIAPLALQRIAAYCAGGVLEAGEGKKGLGMRVESTTGEDGITRVSLIGVMDIAGAEKVDLTMNTIGGSKRKIMVDLSGVTFLASMGIRSILTMARAANRNGGRVVLHSPIATVDKVLRTTGADALTPIFPNEAAAQAALGAD